MPLLKVPQDNLILNTQNAPLKIKLSSSRNSLPSKAIWRSLKKNTLKVDFSRVYINTRNAHVL